MERTSQLEQRFGRLSGSVYVMILTGIGIAFQVLMSQESNAALGSSSPPLLNVTPIFQSPFFLTVLVFPVVYCCVLSLWLTPKSLISPLNIQLGTYAVNTILVLNIFTRNRLFEYYTSPYNMGQTILTFATFWIAGIFFEFVLGLFQTAFVRWFVGLNIGELVPQTYRLGVGFSVVKEVLLSEAFQNVWDLRIELDGKDTFVARFLQMVLALRDCKNYVILSVVPYSEGYYVLGSTTETKDLAQSMLNDLRGRLPNSPQLESLNESDSIVIAVSGIAKHWAALRGQSKVASTRDVWGRLPKYLKWAIGATLLAYGVISGLYFLQQRLKVVMEFSMYVELSAIFFVCFVAELGLAGWQELSKTGRRRKRSLE